MVILLGGKGPSMARMHNTTGMKIRKNFYRFQGNNIAKEGGTLFMHDELGGEGEAIGVKDKSRAQYFFVCGGKERVFLSFDRKKRPRY